MPIRVPPRSLMSMPKCLVWRDPRVYRLWSPVWVDRGGGGRPSRVAGGGGAKAAGGAKAPGGPDNDPTDPTAPVIQLARGAAGSRSAGGPDDKSTRQRDARR